MINAEQIRAARALLDWSTSDLAQQAGLTINGINKIERGHVQAHRETLETLQKIFEGAGIEFLGNSGVQWSQHHVRTLSGVNGLKTFFDDVRHIAQTDTKEIVICGVAEEYLEEKLGDFINYQRKEMESYPTLKMRCLVEEDDLSLGASGYCQYRWLSKEYFSNVPFYIYGDKMAIIVTSGPEDPLILLIENRTIASAYRRQFEAMWSLADKAPTKEGRIK